MIDETTIDDELLLTADAAVAVAWRLVEARLLDECEACVRADGADEVRVARVRDLFARLLREGEPARLETARQMLEAGATNLQ